MHTGLNPQREPTSRLASPQSIGPWNVLSAVRGIEGSDMGSDPFERTPLISVWLWVSDLVLGLGLSGVALDLEALDVFVAVCFLALNHDDPWPPIL